MKRFVELYACILLSSGLIPSMVNGQTKNAECPSGCDADRCQCSEDETGRGMFVVCEGLTESFVGCLDSSVIEFQLHNSTLTSISAEDFRNVTSIEVLDITGNFKLEEIKEHAFRDLTTLRRIFLDHNALSTLEKSIFPTDVALEEIRLNSNKLNRIIHEKVFSGLENSLKELALGFNRLEEFRCPRLLKLVALDLRENRIKVLSKETFEDCPELVEINLSGNLIRELKVSWASLRALYMLDLTDNEISDVEEDFHTSLHTLRYLFLDYNDLRTIPPLPRNLVGLRLNGNRFEKIRNFTFENHTHLTYLDISDVRDLVEIEESAFAGLHSLARLSLSYNFHLNQLPRNPWPDSRELQELRLESNNISVFHWSLFENFDELWSVVISGNPVHCSCDSSWIRVEMDNWDNEWIYWWKNGSRAVTCRTPDNLEGFLISQLNTYDLTCDLSRMEEHSLSTTIDSVILQAVLVEGVPATSWIFPDGRRFYPHRQIGGQLQEDPKLEEILWDNLTILARLTLTNSGQSVVMPGRYVLEWTNAAGSDNYTFTVAEGPNTPIPPGSGSNPAAIAVTILSIAMVIIFVVGGFFLYRYLKARQLNSIQPSNEDADNIPSSVVHVQNEPDSSSLLTPSVGYGATNVG